jgi:hypothetical protein
MFPDNNFSDLDSFKEYLEEHGNETTVGWTIKALYEDGYIALSSDSLDQDLDTIKDNVGLLYEGYNQDKIADLDPVSQELLKFNQEGKDSEYESLYNEWI